MSGKKYLLDTNIIVDLFSGAREIKGLIESLEGPIVSAITMGNYILGLKNRNTGQSI